ncbi:Cdc6/Cdc18 family protein [Halomarina salina]|uniref:Cdc6/Cdc18 family protein n=1 Tax=Halomarina salina TaxID=1872699 RepID=A0ABD5RM03_9EURY|nr:AAA family ATPase [Halomarina salina]
MDLKARIRRRQRSGDESRIVLEYDAISPVAHVEEPTNRGPVLERLLDYLAPVFDEALPPNAYVWGPAGAGKSAVVTALFAHLSRLFARSGSVIHTTTRAQTGHAPKFVYVDARRADSSFGLYHAVLDAVQDDPVPKQGVGTDVLRSRLVDYLRPARRSAVVAVDHIDEPGGLDLATVRETFAVADDSLSWVTVGRTPPSEVPDGVAPPEHIEVPAYEDHALVDILTTRVSEGLARQVVEHEQMRRLASWAEGDAHDALSGLFGAADVAMASDHDRIYERDLEAGMESVPRPSVAVGRVLTLPENRQRVLRRLLDLDDESVRSVGAATEAIAASPAVDLSEATVKRFLYELAEEGIVERVETTEPTNGVGRPPSRIEPLFPTLVFRRLYDRQHDGQD